MSIRIMSSGSIEGRPSRDNRPPVPYGPTTDQGPQQSRERGDRPEQPHQGEMRKTAVLDRDSAAPSSPAPTAESCQGDGITVPSDSQRTFATKSARLRHGTVPLGIPLAAPKRTYRDGAPRTGFDPGCVKTLRLT